MSVRRAVVLAAAVLLLGACTHRKAPVIDETVTRTVTHPAYVPPPASDIAGFDPAQPPPAGSKQGACPYLDRETARDLEGNRIEYSIVFAAQGTAPPRCRFFFWSGPPFHATLDVHPQRFASAQEAYAAMVATGKAGKSVEGVKDLVSGVDAVLYQTRFFAEDNGTDWACTYAKGDLIVTVRTDEKRTSRNARNICEVLAPKLT